MWKPEPEEKGRRQLANSFSEIILVFGADRKVSVFELSLNEQTELESRSQGPSGVFDLVSSSAGLRGLGRMEVLE